MAKVMRVFQNGCASRDNRLLGIQTIAEVMRDHAVHLPKGQVFAGTRTFTQIGQEHSVHIVFGASAINPPNASTKKYSGSSLISFVLSQLVQIAIRASISCVGAIIATPPKLKIQNSR
jgi:hypothetical protein